MLQPSTTCYTPPGGPRGPPEHVPRPGQGRVDNVDSRPTRVKRPNFPAVRAKKRAPEPAAPACSPICAAPASPTAIHTQPHASAAQLAKASKTAAIRAEPKAYVAAKQGTQYYSLLTLTHSL
eukprot:scaffold34018_cov75-Phaeocystis_antarctica.AAC.6